MGYKSIIVPKYISYMSFETAHKTAHNGEAALTFNGFKMLLAHKVMADPNAAFATLPKGLAGLNIESIVLKRSDFSASANADSLAKEAFIREARAKAKADGKAVVNVVKFLAAVNGTPIGGFMGN